MTQTLESTADFNEIVADLVGAVEGDLTSRSRVVDGLLDLRNASRVPVVRSRLDELLATIPGVNTVPNGWWVDRLEELGSLDA